MRTLFSVILVVLLVICVAPGQAFSAQLTPPVGSDLTKPVGAVFFDLNGSADAERQEQIDNQEIPSFGESSFSSHNVFNSVVEGIVGPPPWLNVPMSRIRFDTAEDQGVGWFSRVTSKNLGGVMASLADGLFIGASMFVNWGIEIIYLAFRSNWIAALASQVTAPTQAMWTNLFGSGLGGSSFFGIIMIALMGFLLVYFARMQFLKIIKAAIMTILILSFAFVYFSNAEKFLLGVSDVTDELSGFVLSAVGGSFTGQSGQSGLDSMLQSFGQSMWCSLVANSWSVMEFGTSVPQNLLLTEPEFTKMKENTTIAANSYTPGTNPPQRIDPFTAGWIKPEASRIDQILLAYSVNNVARGEIVNVLANPDIDHGKHTIAREKLLPYNKILCIVFSLIFLLVGLGFFIFCVFIGGSMIIAQIMLLGIALALPIIIFISMIPETGWAFGYKTFRLSVAALGTKVMYGVFLSVIVMLVNFIFWITN